MRQPVVSVQVHRVRAEEQREAPMCPEERGEMPSLLEMPVGGAQRGEIVQIAAIPRAVDGVSLETRYGAVGSPPLAETPRDGAVLAPQGARR